MAQLSDSIAISRGGVIGKTTLNDLPVSSATLDAINANSGDGSATEASTVNTGCLNVNPYFELGDADYSDYAVIDTTGSSDRCITPLASHNTRYGLQVRNFGGTLIGNKTLPALTGFELRATIRYRFRVYGSAVDPAKSYAFRIYMGTKCYDATDRFVRYADVYKMPVGCRTTFAQPVTNGDTTITINTPATAWYSDGTNVLNHRKSFRCFKPDAFGNQIYTSPISGIPYSEWGYSVDSGYYGYLNYAENIDGTTTVNLRLPWSFGNYDIGDGIVSSQGGGTYQYWASGNSLNHPDTANGQWSPWLTMQSSWELLDGDTLSATTKFREASAYGQFLMLPNYRLYEDNVVIATSTGQVEYETQYSKLALEWRHAP